MSDDSDQLLALLELGETSIADFTTLVEELGDAEWERATDLAGWTVHDVVSHTAHLESVIAGGPEETLDVAEDLEHVRNAMGTYTEQGVVARRDRTREELLAEIADAPPDGSPRRGRRRRPTPRDHHRPTSRAGPRPGWTC